MTNTFWEARPILRHVLTLARARMVGPWAVLGNAMIQVIATIPPTITLPAIVGGRGSLNMCVAIVGHSSGGKGTSTAATREGIHFAGEIPTVPIGTGQGIARTFRPHGTEPDDDNPIVSAIFTAEEIDSWAALTSRTESTLSADVRKMYSGETIGYGNAGKETRVVVPAHSYRASILIGVQPERSTPLLNAADGGLPQRFVWMPTDDPDAPDDPPDDPEPFTVPLPAWNRHLSVVGGTPGRSTELEVPESARNMIVRHRQAVLRGDYTVDPLDGHGLFTRLKVAVALMALDGRVIVSDEDWILAGFVMDASDRTRERCRLAIENVARRSNTARALATAERDEIIFRTTEAEEDTFPRSYVEELRQENGRYRQRAQRADDLARRLHTELVRATGKLADPSDMPFDENHLDDPGALDSAIDELIVSKPHLASRRPIGEIGQGATSSATNVDLAAILRQRAG